jgi:Multiubiquitin
MNERQAERPGDAAHHVKETEIVVNGRPKAVAGDVITFEQVVALALDPVPEGPNVVITVTYSHGRGPKHEGTLSPGHSVEIKNGTRFNVKATDKS